MCIRDSLERRRGEILRETYFEDVILRMRYEGCLKRKEWQTSEAGGRSSDKTNIWIMTMILAVIIRIMENNSNGGIRLSKCKRKVRAKILFFFFFFPTHQVGLQRLNFLIFSCFLDLYVIYLSYYRKRGSVPDVVLQQMLQQTSPSSQLFPEKLPATSDVGIPLSLIHI